MITNAKTFEAVPFTRMTAIHAAYRLYRKWGTDFVTDLDHYLTHGVVISKPNVFGLAQTIKHPVTGELAWFVRMSVGRLADLLDALPVSDIKWIAFCRHKKSGSLDDRIRVYPIQRAKQVASTLQRFNASTTTKEN